MTHMLHSSHDMLFLVAEINVRRFRFVYDRHVKRTGMRGLPPKIMENLKCTRRLHHRYLKGDYRHNSAELGRVKELCSWLVETYANDHGHEVKTFRFDERGMETRTPLQNGAYHEWIRKVHSAE